MKKIIATITVLIMAFSAIMPFVIADDTLDLGGVIEYQTGGSSSESIVALWVTNAANGDENTLKMGCQIDPPCVYDEYVTVTFFAAIYHESGFVVDDDDVKFDISWPENNEREGLGIGGWKARDIKTVVPATYGEYYDFHLLDIPPNTPIICYRNEADDGAVPDGHAFVSEKSGEGLITFKKVTYDIYYHDPAGWYDMNVSLITENVHTWEKMWFEYVLALGIEIDNSVVDFGIVSLNGQWYTAHGDWSFVETNLRTVRNIGNWDVELGANFTNGTFHVNNVLFDVRIGEVTDDNGRQNDSYVERYSPDHHPDHYPAVPYGMYPLIEYWTIPVDNEDEVGPGYDEVLLKCHTAKIDFKIYPIQWNAFPGQYTFDIDLLWRMPGWGVADCHPCEGHTY